MDDSKKNGKNQLQNNSASYLVRKFLASEESYELDLNYSHIAILYTIAHYLDLPAKQCFSKQKLLAEEARMSERKFRDDMQWLVDNKLIFRFFRGKLYRHELGEKITCVKN